MSDDNSGAAVHKFERKQIMKYEIKNQPFTVLTLKMEEGESIKCQSGAMA